MLHPDMTEKLLVHKDQLKQTIAPHFKLVSVNLDEQNYPKTLPGNPYETGFWQYTGNKLAIHWQ